LTASSSLRIIKDFGEKKIDIPIIGKFFFSLEFSKKFSHLFEEAKRETIIQSSALSSSLLSNCVHGSYRKKNMGVNFYCDFSPKEESKCSGSCDFQTCKDCQSLEERWVHIGKSSCGWYFNVHTYSKSHYVNEAALWKLGPISSWEDWKIMLQSHKCKIYDESRNDVTFEELRAKVEDRARPDVMSVADCDPLTLRQFADKELFYDKKRNLMYPTDNKAVYEHAWDSIGSGPWVCRSGRNFS
jgi:hypothetical protein